VGATRRIGGTIDQNPEARVRLEKTEAQRRFAAAPVARLATVGADGRPHLVPIVFTVHGDVLHFAVDQKPKTTTALRRLVNIAVHPEVSLLVDHYEPDWSRLWWVRADGTARVLDEPAEQALDRLAARYPAYTTARPLGPVVEVTVDRWTGWAADGEVTSS
jgi:PPOX class probable F420-dependent enzyme